MLQSVNYHDKIEYLRRLANCDPKKVRSKCQKKVGQRDGRVVGGATEGTISIIEPENLKKIKT